jgi:hypothetical protein
MIAIEPTRGKYLDKRKNAAGTPHGAAHISDVSRFSVSV